MKNRFQSPSSLRVADDHCQQCADKVDAIDVVCPGRHEHANKHVLILVYNPLRRDAANYLHVSLLLRNCEVRGEVSAK
jgi:hypothetical protein